MISFEEQAILYKEHRETETRLDKVLKELKEELSKGEYFLRGQPVSREAFEEAIRVIDATRGHHKDRANFWLNHMGKKMECREV